MIAIVAALAATISAPRSAARRERGEFRNAMSEAYRNCDQAAREIGPLTLSNAPSTSSK